MTTHETEVVRRRHGWLLWGWRCTCGRYDWTKGGRFAAEQQALLHQERENR